MKTKTLKPNTDKRIRQMVTAFIRWQTRVCDGLQGFAGRFSVRTQAIVYALIMVSAAGYCIRLIIIAIKHIIG